MSHQMNKEVLKSRVAGKSEPTIQNGTKKDDNKTNNAGSIIRKPINCANLSPTPSQWTASCEMFKFLIYHLTNSYLRNKISNVFRNNDSIVMGALSLIGALSWSIPNATNIIYKIFK